MGYPLDGGSNEFKKKKSGALHQWGFTYLLLWRVPQYTSADRYRVPKSTLCIWILLLGRVFYALFEFLDLSHEGRYSIK